MRFLTFALFLSSAYPLAVAFRANRSTTLFHALVWTAFAWLLWLPVLGMEEVTTQSAYVVLALTRYLALALTGCAGIAVLGARRPIVMAWNGVLLGLLAVLFLPLLESLLVQRPLLDPLRLVFLGGTLAVGALNYLPTRYGPGILAIGLGGLLELAILAEWWAPWPGLEPMGILAPLGCWIAWMSRDRSERLPFDQKWLEFRDRFGLFWSQRTREQFNNAAMNAGWPLRLRWRGLRKDPSNAAQGFIEAEATMVLLHSLLKRFESGAD